jgi:hypothetical protein
MSGLSGQESPLEVDYGDDSSGPQEDEGASDHSEDVNRSTSRGPEPVLQALGEVSESDSG